MVQMRVFLRDFFFLLELSYPDKKGKEVTYYLAKLPANFLDSVI